MRLVKKLNKSTRIEEFGERNDMSIQHLTNPKAILTASIPATIVLAIFMEGVARIMLGGPMKPGVIICGIFGWGDDLLWLGEVIHYALGLILFPIGYLIALAITGMRAGLVSGIIWGVILWIAAGTIFMGLAGNFFWGFSQTTIASLIAHVAYGAVLGALMGRVDQPQTA